MSSGHIHSIVSHHSSTHVELVALRLGCHHVDTCGLICYVTFLSSSHLTFLVVGWWLVSLALVVQVRIALQTLHSQGLEIHLVVDTQPCGFAGEEVG